MSTTAGISRGGKSSMAAGSQKMGIERGRKAAVKGCLCVAVKKKRQSLQGGRDLIPYFVKAFLLHYIKINKVPVSKK